MEMPKRFRVRLFRILPAISPLVGDIFAFRLLHVFILSIILNYINKFTLRRIGVRNARHYRVVLCARRSFLSIFLFQPSMTDHRSFCCIYSIIIIIMVICAYCLPHAYGCSRFERLVDVTDFPRRVKYIVLDHTMCTRCKGLSENGE